MRTQPLSRYEKYTRKSFWEIAPSYENILIIPRKQDAEGQQHPKITTQQLKASLTWEPDRMFYKDVLEGMLFSTYIRETYLGGSQHRGL